MSFVKQFDPIRESDVLWLQKIDEAMRKASDQEKYGSVDFLKSGYDKPSGIQTKKPMEWAESHFQLCMKYSQAVLRGVAFIPTQGSTD
jgi:hypothetical protein